MPGGGGFDKQPASRILRSLTIAYIPTSAGAGPTVFSTTFLPSTQQIRVISSLAGYAAIEQSTSSLTVTSGTIPSGMQIPASNSGGEYFTVTPGQFLSFGSSSTTTSATVATSGATGLVTITEMA